MFRQALSVLLVSSFVILSSGSAPFAQSITIFPNAVPNNPTGAGATLTLGVKFWSSQSGTLSAIRFYRATVSAQRYVAKAGSRFPGINLIINPAGPGVSSDADTVLNVTIVATQ